MFENHCLINSNIVSRVLPPPIKNLHHQDQKQRTLLCLYEYESQFQVPKVKTSNQSLKNFGNIGCFGVTGDRRKVSWQSTSLTRERVRAKGRGRDRKEGNLQGTTRSFTDTARDFT